ncbi:excinuclease ABC subunit A [Candidatus Beckwithbacteria bacterium RIFCSPLOWO2_02_FULL_49_12]|nr:MAG: excinuclease ABC subunit A [Candidatus Beckwithbacteria bacterium RIFCSPLOWO2_02_FULL_49_12]
MNHIAIQGARQHNLKNIAVKIPKGKLVVFSGLSGSGKSSLAFDTIYAEGQRRYVESLSSYARQFLGLMTKPDVDQIDGLSPAIAIDQKTTSSNPRSTVGTITEVYDYLRLLYARIGPPHCANCGREIAKQSLDQIAGLVKDLILTSLTATKPSRFIILSPVVRDKKGEFSQLFNNLAKKGFVRVRIDGKFFDLDSPPALIKTNRHTIDAVVERLSFTKKQAKDASEVDKLKKRLSESLEAALKLSDGLALAVEIKDASLNFPDHPQKLTDHLFSEHFACHHCNLSLPEIEPRIFSFNSPHGACPTCSGLGHLQKIDPDKIIAPSLTLAEGAIIPFAKQLSADSWLARTVKEVVHAHRANTQTRWDNLSDDLQHILLYGTKEIFEVTGTNRFGRITTIHTDFEGAIPALERRFQETQSDFIRNEMQKFMSLETCPDCNGDRLKPESLSVSIDNLNIADLTKLSIKDTFSFIANLTQKGSPLSDKERQIGQLILKELATRLKFLLSVGLDYLTLSRAAGTLAGGEAQRIRLASQIGTGLTGVLYILDEPSIGLHQRDNRRLITTLKNLRDLDNSVIVVEHDREIIESADYLIDFGPLAGKHGGEVVAAGTPKQVAANPKSLTGKYLNGKKKVSLSLPASLPLEKNQKMLTLAGCTQNNLKNIKIDFPLSQFIVITGVSGSGKSSLIHDTLYPAVKDNLKSPHSPTPQNYHHLSGLEHLTRVSLIDQSPIGRTPRSNPATYTKAFDHIRTLFSLTRDAKVAGFKPGRFSFNVKGGRCESCQGEGQVKIEMQFMPDVYITCEVCHGARYNQQTLAVKYHDQDISQILHLTVDEALEFFPSHQALHLKLKTLKDVGLGYIELGQPAPTLSGGEAQRVKLAKELSVKSQGHTLYLLDEPTTGLHFEDLKKLLFVLKQLVNQNNTVVVIEHNLDVVKNADWVIDLGPEGGEAGGQVVATGTPQQLAKITTSYTGHFLKKIL